MAPIHTVRADLVDRIVRAAGPALTSLGLSADVVRRYHRDTAVDDLEDRSATDLAGAAVTHLRLAGRRTEGETVVRVYNPAPEEDGWQSRHTIVQVVTDDRPFLVDSTLMELSRHSLGIHLAVHPVLDGVSFIHVEVDRHTDPAFFDELGRDLRRVLGDVQAVTDDWRAMRNEMVAAADRLGELDVDTTDDIAEAQRLLRWLADDHFTFIGSRRYDLIDDDGTDALVARPETGLGILRGGAPVARSFAKLPAEVRRRARERRVLNLTKANSFATVHRPSRLDYVGVKLFDERGEVVGEQRFLGLFTSTVYTTPVLDVPWAGRKARAVVERAGFDAGSHDEKELLDVLGSYPREVLFQIDSDELHDQAVAMLQLAERRRVRLFASRDTFGRFVSCLVFLPRDRFNTETRLAMQSVLLEAYGGSSIDYTTRLSESVLVRLHFVVHVDDEHRDAVDPEVVEARLAEVTRSWPDELHDALVEAVGEDRGVRRHRRWAAAFPAAYREAFPARVAVGDIERLEQLDGTGPAAVDGVVVHVYTPPDAPEGEVRCKLVLADGPLSLSDVLPHLQGFGVTVVDERPFTIRDAGTGSAEGEPTRWIYDFGLRATRGVPVPTGDARDRMIETFTRLWRGEVESDGLNRLVLAAGLGWRDVAVLRAYGRYLRQVGSTFTPAYVEDTLVRHPDIAGDLVELFVIRFDPDLGGAPTDADEAIGTSWRDERAAPVITAIEQALDEVPSLDDDRILRSFLALVRATLRTNVFIHPSDEAPPTVTVKLDPSNVPGLPLPRPRFELYVHSPRVEGVHLRAGPVARGGIRWSDRREDYRTEVLGLMKAQAVKNAVIVPVGAKGGFIVKQPPEGGDRAALQAEVVACYRTFIGALLELTDNNVEGTVVPPERVVRYDDDDPYLVVAADKGTASFSDIANELAVERGFWLGDAFASGGSAGYDHKAMGITARGAWESVKRHFRNLGLDADHDEITVAGIGDMSGDVFGNGLLRSQHVKLVAAFDHRHVFLDPNPDPAVSFAERERLFDLAGSSWADYDTGLLSSGGGVFPRTAKSIPLSAEARRILGLEAEALPPNEVVQAILRAPVDLLWNGGIGTYVKAATEAHAEVGDKANDAVRVDGVQLRCRVVGEGGNLGFTQLARIEAARHGVRINTDAIDNSAGVDCSDHEVNIKILLDSVVAAGDLTARQRNDLLATMTDEVAGLVLTDNAEQAQALDNSTYQAAGMVEVHTRYLHHLERVGGLDRAVEHLPDDEELAERAAVGEGLTAPEFAVVMAYTKNVLQQELVGSAVPEDPWLGRALEAYFPAPLRRGDGDAAARCRRAMDLHPLRREIVATVIANRVVNRAGTTFLFRLQGETDASVADLVRAEAAAHEVFALEPLWQEVRALDAGVPAERQTAMLLEIRRLAERATRWLLVNRPRPLDVAATAEAMQRGVAEVAGALDRLVTGPALERLRTTCADHVAAGVPVALATRIGGLAPLSAALDIVDVATTAEESVGEVARVHYLLDEVLALGWLREAVVALPRQDRWQALARASLRDELFRLHAAVTADVHAVAGDGGDAAVTADVHAVAGDGGDAAVRTDRWVAHGADRVDRFRAMAADVASVAEPDLAMLSVLVRELGSLVTAPGATAPGGTGARTP